MPEASQEWGGRRDVTSPLSSPVVQDVWKRKGMLPEKVGGEEGSKEKARFYRSRCRGSAQKEDGAYMRFC